MKVQNDEENVLLAESQQVVDNLNSEFYGLFPYPWPPTKFDTLLDPYFEAEMLCQSIGDWSHQRLPKRPMIWVAGCGTNQAIFTALKFPNAQIIASDLSKKSLSLCAHHAKQLGISNLQLMNESINQAHYKSQFDLVICTGVIHHNADPQIALNKLSAALKPNGIMELMVYNRFHRILTSAFQKAVRILEGDQQKIDFNVELILARKLITALPAETQFSTLNSQHKNSPEALVADALLQPVEYSYTVESLEQMAREAELDIMLPCLNEFDKDTRTFQWNMNFEDVELKQRYDALPDVVRWQVTNLLLNEKSPMLWFYFQKRESQHHRKTEHQVCEEFLDQIFVKAQTMQKSYFQGSKGDYHFASAPVAFPQPPTDSLLRKIYDAVDGRSSMREVFSQLRLETNFHDINQLRLKLTTPLFPYLKSLQENRQTFREK